MGVVVTVTRASKTKKLCIEDVRWVIPIETEISQRAAGGTWGTSKKLSAWSKSLKEIVVWPRSIINKGRGMVEADINNIKK